MKVKKGFLAKTPASSPVAGQWVKEWAQGLRRRDQATWDHLERLFEETVAGVMAEDAGSIPDEAKTVLMASVHPLETALAYFEEDILRTKELTVWTHLVRGHFLASGALSLLTGVGYFDARRKAVFSQRDSLDKEGWASSPVHCERAGFQGWVEEGVLSKKLTGRISGHVSGVKRKGGSLPGPRRHQTKSRFVKASSFSHLSIRYPMAKLIKEKLKPIVNNFTLNPWIFAKFATTRIVKDILERSKKNLPVFSRWRSVISKIRIEDTSSGVKHDLPINSSVVTSAASSPVKASGITARKDALVIRLQEIFDSLDLAQKHINVVYHNVEVVNNGTFEPTPVKVLADLFSEAGVGPGVKLFDFGFGDGRTLHLGRALGAQVLGYEKNRNVFEYSQRIYTEKIEVFFPEPKRVRFPGDGLRADLRKFDVIYYYLAGSLEQEGIFFRKVFSGLRPGARFVLYAPGVVRRDGSHQELIVTGFNARISRGGNALIYSREPGAARGSSPLLSREKVLDLARRRLAGYGARTFIYHNRLIQEFVEVLGDIEHTEKGLLHELSPEGGNKVLDEYFLLHKKVWRRGVFDLDMALHNYGRALDGSIVIFDYTRIQDFYPDSPELTAARKIILFANKKFIPEWLTWEKDIEEKVSWGSLGFPNPYLGERKTDASSPVARYQNFGRRVEDLLLWKILTDSGKRRALRKLASLQSEIRSMGRPGLREKEVLGKISAIYVVGSYLFKASPGDIDVCIIPRKGAWDQLVFWDFAESLGGRLRLKNDDPFFIARESLLSTMANTHLYLNGSLIYGEGAALRAPTKLELLVFAYQILPPGFGKGSRLAQVLLILERAGIPLKDFNMTLEKVWAVYQRVSFFDRTTNPDLHWLNERILAIVDREIGRRGPGGGASSPLSSSSPLLPREAGELFLLTNPIYRPGFIRSLEVIRDVLGHHPAGARVLIVGAAREPYQAVAFLGTDVTAVDILPEEGLTLTDEYRRLLRAAGGKYAYRQLDAGKLSREFPADSFDMVIASNFFDSPRIVNKEVIARNILEVFKDNGRMLIGPMDGRVDSYFPGGVTLERIRDGLTAGMLPIGQREPVVDRPELVLCAVRGAFAASSPVIPGYGVSPVGDSSRREPTGLRSQGTGFRAQVVGLSEQWQEPSAFQWALWFEDYYYWLWYKMTRRIKIARDWIVLNVPEAIKEAGMAMGSGQWSAIRDREEVTRDTIDEIRDTNFPVGAVVHASVEAKGSPLAQDWHRFYTNKLDLLTPNHEKYFPWFVANFMDPDKADWQEFRRQVEADPGSPWQTVLAKAREAEGRHVAASKD